MKERSRVLVQGSVPLPRSWLGPGLGGEMELQPIPGAEEKWEKGDRKRSQLPFILGPTCKHLLKDQ